MGIQFLMSVWLSAAWNGIPQTESGDNQDKLLPSILLAFCQFRFLNRIYAGISDFLTICNNNNNNKNPDTCRGWDFLKKKRKEKWSLEQQDLKEVFLLNKPQLYWISLCSPSSVLSSLSKRKNSPPQRKKKKKENYWGFSVVFMGSLKQKDNLVAWDPYVLNLFNVEKKGVTNEL